jgi:PelA/Pel-15E family pectate lyase
MRRDIGEIACTLPDYDTGVMSRVRSSSRGAALPERPRPSAPSRRDFGRLFAVGGSATLGGWLTASRLLARSDQVRAIGSAATSPPPATARLGAQIRWSDELLRQQPEWYASGEARAVADSVIQYQSPQGGWPKATNLAAPPRSPEDIPSPQDGRANTIDNGATTLPMQFLALVAHSTGVPRYREAFSRGLDYLLAAQYPNGGWPQFFPLREGYYSRITYNDDAMARVLNLLCDAAAGERPYAFVDEPRRAGAAAAVTRGIDVILRTQVKQGGKLTAWCAQHDEKTLAPAWGRAYEPPSLSGSESVGIIRVLMKIGHPSPEVMAAIESAVTWLRAVAIHGVRVEPFTSADRRRDRRVVADPRGSALWARFYELTTNRPIFLGRDSVVRYAFSEIEPERRNGYAYYGTWPATLLAEDLPRWREKHKR